jgi:hypothetical protein
MSLPYFVAAVGIKSLKYDPANPNFNLVCNSQKAVQTLTVVKFEHARAAIESRGLRASRGGTSANPLEDYD